jgi:hypothetical protein
MYDKHYPASMFVATLSDKDGHTFAYLTRRFSPGLQWLLRVFTRFQYAE